MAMILDLSDEEARALLNVLIDTIEADRYPMSPRIRLLQAILGKCAARSAGSRRNSRHGCAAICRHPQPNGRRQRMHNYCVSSTFTTYCRTGPVPVGAGPALQR